MGIARQNSCVKINCHRSCLCYGKNIKPSFFFSFSYGYYRAKRFPIKLESKTSVIYNGSKTFYIFLETSWEKESWCKALRLASCDKKERVDWFAKLHKEFHNYLTNLNAGYPSFMKPSTGSCAEPVDQTNRPDGTSSKVRLFLKKIARKTSRVGQENKSSVTSLSGRVERKASEKIRPCQETVSATGLVKTAPLVKRSKSEENMVQSSSSSTFSHSGSQSHISVFSDADSDDKFGNDEGTLCWNLLISRLFFDLKSNTDMKRSIQSRIQVYSIPLPCIFDFICLCAAHMLYVGKGRHGFVLFLFLSSICRNFCKLVP
jgi:hypothetical protein